VLLALGAVGIADAWHYVAGGMKTLERLTDVLAKGLHDIANPSE
jgi:hypothetical protein